MATARLTEIRGEPLGAVVLRSLREAIVDGRLMPGAAINEVQISRQLGVSRAPLREALRSLANEGLVASVPYRGAIVTPLTERGIQELQAFRRLVEVFASEQVIARAGDDEIDALEIIVAEMERCADAADLACMSAADVRFHTQIIELSGNGLLLDVWHSYSSRIRRALALRNQANSNLPSIVEMHRNLADAFRARDLAAVKRCYDNHGTDIAVALRHLFAASPDGNETPTPTEPSAPAATTPLVTKSAAPPGRVGRQIISRATRGE